MMMALRNSPSEHALLDALEGARSRRAPRALTFAIGASIALHVGLVAYLAIERMGGLAPLGAEAPATSISFVRLAPNPPPPAPHPKADDHQPPVTHRPLTLPEQPPTLIQPLNPQQNIVPRGPQPIADFHPVNPTHMIEDPHWLSRPTAAEMSRFYPQGAIDRDLDGQAQLICGVVASGRLTDCKVTGETPAGAGFGPAALELAPYFRMTPKTVDGQPVDGGVTRISIAFNLD